MRKLVVLGIGGFGREIMEAVHQQNQRTKEYEILGFVDDKESMQGKTINGYRVIGTSEYLLNIEETVQVLICVGERCIREKVVEKLSSNSNIQYPNFVADHVTYHPEVTKMGKGNIIYSNSILTVNIELGDFNYINSACSVSHDVKIGNFVTLSPSSTLAGDVTVGDGSYIGMGSVVREGVTIGSNVVVGMGSVVVKNIEDNTVAYGNPCEVVRGRSREERVFG